MYDDANGGTDRIRPPFYRRRLPGVCTLASGERFFLLALQDLVGDAVLEVAVVDAEVLEDFVDVLEEVEVDLVEVEVVSVVAGAVVAGATVAAGVVVGAAVVEDEPPTGAF